jgi:hypothetical protein
MRRLLPIVCAALVAGCGQAATETAQFEGAEREVADLIAEYSAAGERRDGGRICKEILAESLVEAIEEGGDACSQELERSLREADEHALEVEEVTVTGSTATARVRGDAGDQERTATFELVDERGAWRIEAVR